jgi:Zn finger protein HypA/HybF involved in hydrogenase expression
MAWLEGGRVVISSRPYEAQCLSCHKRLVLLLGDNVLPVGHLCPYCENLTVICWHPREDTV